MSRRITITTGARLHFGLLAHKPKRGPHFGGVGLMVDAPRCRITLTECFSGEESAAAGDTLEPQIQHFVKLYQEQAPRDRQPPACRIEIEEQLPSHAGFGSGTQLAMAVAQGLALLAGDGRVGTVTLARRVGRGRRSAIGVHGFARGGLLVDGGKTDDDQIGTLVARSDFPDDWRWVLITPTEETGLAGDREQDAFSRLPSMPRETTDRLCGLAVRELLPAVIEANLSRAGEALYEFGRTVGEFFAPVQGGTYAHPATRELVEKLRRDGIQGVAQTSWGPTIVALCPDEAAAHNIARDILHDMVHVDCNCRVAAPMNTGAVIETTPSP
jgi:beta-RFAP synthase